MRELSPEFQSHLDSGATTICNCWLVEREDGFKAGFTDHDKPLYFEDITFEPDAGFLPSEVSSSLGLSVDTSEVEGALSNERLTEEDIHAGLYDRARVTIFSVNWQDVSQRIKARVAEIGEITREDGVFRAELRSLGYRLNQRQGRLFERNCDANLGDSRCRKNLNDPAYLVETSVKEVLDQNTIVVEGGIEYATGWFDRGTLTWTSGENIGRQIEIESARRSTGGLRVALWLPMAKTISVGDQLQLRAGCDKQFATCKAKFQNAVNYQGFPHIPGNDAIFQTGQAGGGHNGRALVE